MSTYKTTLDSTSLIHGVYRSLLNTGRTYAAFRKEQIVPLLEKLKDRKEILDPMSGYGGLMTYCSQSDYPLKSYCIECNPPSYFWQLLVHPDLHDTMLEICNHIKDCRRKWPKSSKVTEVSQDWFPQESLRILYCLWDFIFDITTSVSKKNPDKLALALLLPFVGRLSSYVQGNVVTHVKKGGICVYLGWRDDFLQYLEAITSFIEISRQQCKRKKHTIVLADAQSFTTSNKIFSAMVTSPPYPNGRDYSKMFAPENEFINCLVEKELIDNFSLNIRLIGSPIVSEKESFIKRNPEEIRSRTARNFLDFLFSYSKTERAISDNRSYYIPYYCNYFYGIEKAYENISKLLSKDFEGYIIAVNNTARKKVIPVSDMIIETWKHLGFKASIHSSEELATVGGINPRAKGISARHIEYTIKIWR